ncbi:MAG: antitoxin [Verrucomicrobiia bacterium]|jgi:predicted DNA binding CopG/RHH family protein
MKKQAMDSEEKKILASYERNEWRPVKNGGAEIARLRQYARNTLQKNKRINIRLAGQDLAGIQTRAVEEGMPYQTLISSILHKYLSGRLIERKTV